MENKNKMLQELISRMKFNPVCYHDKYANNKIEKNIIDHLVKKVEEEMKTYIGDKDEYYFVLAFVDEIITQRSCEERLELKNQLETIIFGDLYNDNNISVSQLGIYSALRGDAKSIGGGLKFLSKIKRGHL